MRILFSQLGFTDPVRIDRRTQKWFEGPMMQLVRDVNPDKIYLWYTKELIEIHNMDLQECAEDRYEKAIHCIYKDVQIEKIFKDKLENPHLFDEVLVLAEDIRNIYKQNSKSGEKVEIFLNLTSGTPAMEAINAILSVELPYCQGIQVATPTAASNASPQKYADISSALEVVVEEKNTRCIYPKLHAIRNFAEKNRVISLIRGKEYTLGRKLASESDTFLSHITKDWLEFGSERSKMHLESAKKMLKKFRGQNRINWENSKKMFPLEGNTEAEELFEYFLTMDINNQSGDYAELLTKITPFMFELLLIHVSKNLGGFDFIEECCNIDDSDKDNVMYWLNREPRPWEGKDNYVRHDIMLALDAAFPKYGFRDTYATVHNLALVCASKPLRAASEANAEIVALLTEKRSNGKTLAENINGLRNIIAHHIFDVDEKKFKSKTTIRPAEMVEIMFKAFCIVFNDISRETLLEYRRVYDDVLNSIIIETMN